MSKTQSCSFLFKTMQRNVFSYLNRDFGKCSTFYSIGSLGGMILTNLFNDIRLVGIIGCLLAATGFSVSYFVNDVSVLALTYGALGGKCNIVP